MNSTVKSIALIIVVIGLLLGVRYVASVIRYGCADVPLENVEGGDDCAPPFVGVGMLGWFITGGSFNPLFNRDATAVEKIEWKIEKANPSITNEDDSRFYEQKIAAEVTFKDGKTKSYELGTAYGCTGATKNEIGFEERKRFFGKVECYFAATGVSLAAFNQNNGFRIERYDESAKDGSIKTSVLLAI